MKKLLCAILLLLCLTAHVGQSEYVPVKMFGQQLNLGRRSTDGLVFYWRGIPAGNAVDESPYRNNGTITGARWIGDGLTFDGSDPSTSYVTLPALPLQGNDITIVASIKSADTSTPSAQWIYKQWGSPISDGPALFGVGTTIRWEVGADRVEIAGGIIQDTWQHIVAVKQGTLLTIYIDGVSVVSDNKVITHTTNQTAYISGNSAGGVDAFNGIIKQCNVYNRALSAGEILDLYINPDLPMQQERIWLMYSPGEPSGIVPIIQAHTRRRRAG